MSLISLNVHIIQVCIHIKDAEDAPKYNAWGLGYCGGSSGVEWLGWGKWVVNGT